MIYEWKQNSFAVFQKCIEPMVFITLGRSFVFPKNQRATNIEPSSKSNVINTDGYLQRPCTVILKTDHAYQIKCTHIITIIVVRLIIFFRTQQQQPLLARDSVVTNSGVLLSHIALATEGSRPKCCL